MKGPAPISLDDVERLAAAGRWDEARARYRRHLGRHAKDWRLYYRIGMLEAAGGHFEVAARAMRKARELNPGDPQVDTNLAQILVHAGLPEEALSLLSPLEPRIGHLPGFQKLFGTALLACGRHEAAETALRKALAGGEDAAVLNNLGLILRGDGRLDEAARMFSRALRVQRTPETLTNLASLYLALGLVEEARTLFVAAVRAAPLDPLVLRSVAIFHRDAGEPDAAVLAAKRAAIARPDLAIGMTFLGELADRRAELETAGVLLARATVGDPEDPHAAALMGRVLRRQKRLDEAERILAAAAGATGQARRGLYRVGFELAQLYEARRQPEEAYRWFDRANRQQRDEVPAGAARPERAFAEITALKQAFAGTPRWIGEVEADVADEFADPVFLVGFPRSGTTLLDQILDSHDRVEVLEERPLVAGLIARMRELGVAYPSALENLDAARISELRRFYFAQRDRYLTPAAGHVFVDKMPLNIVHAGLIRRVFPKARFILALRHPCDVCLSCFMQSFALNHWMAVFTSLPETVRLYRELFSLWRLYVDRLGFDFVAVRYEDLIADLRAAAEPILGFLGLDWEDRMAEFHRHALGRKVLATPSYAQVTRPIYGDAVARWRRYGFVMEDAARTLADEIRQFGYGDEDGGT